MKLPIVHEHPSLRKGQSSIKDLVLMWTKLLKLLFNGTNIFYHKTDLCGDYSLLFSFRNFL